MSLDVFEEEVGPDESSSAGGADKLLLPRVSSLVAGELVTPGEYLVAVRVGTVERFLSFNIIYILHISIRQFWEGIFFCYFLGVIKKC